MAWGAAATGTPARHRLDRPGALADAGVARRDHARPAPAGRAQHGAGAGRLLAGHPRRRPRRLPRMPVLAPMDVPEAVELTQLRVPPRRQRGATRCCSSATTTSRTRPARSTPSPRRPPSRRRADDWALDGSTSGTGTGRAGVAARHHQAARRRRLRPRRALRASARARPRRCSPASSRWSRPAFMRRRRGRRGRVRHARASTCAPRSPACAPRAHASGTCGRSRCCPFPTDAVAAAAAGAPRRRRSTRTTRARWSTTCASPSLGARAGRVHRRPEPRQLRLRHRPRSRRRRSCAHRIARRPERPVSMT